MGRKHMDESNISKSQAPLYFLPAMLVELWPLLFFLILFPHVLVTYCKLPDPATRQY